MSAAITWTRRGTKSFDQLPSHAQVQALRAIHNIATYQGLGHEKFYRVHGAEGGFIVKASKRVRVVLDKMPGGWQVRDVIDRTDNRYFRRE